MNPMDQTSPSATTLNKYRKVFQVLSLTLLSNLLVSFGKIVVGMVVNSLSMVADGVHSLLDAAANVVGLVSVSIASKPADEDHPYGHQKFEVVASLVIAILMGVACVEILERVLGRFFFHAPAPDPNILSFAVMAAAMLISAWISWFEGKNAKQLGSSLLSADSAHTGSDTLSAAAVFMALAGAHFGLGWVDWLASLIVVVIVAGAAMRIVNQSLSVLSDRVMLDPEQVKEVVRSVPGILACHKVRSHGMPGHIHVDLHIQVSPTMTISESHALTHRVIAVVKESRLGVQEVFVHTEPVKPEDLQETKK